MKPICYLRMLNGKPDWAEDCISEDGSGILDHECYKAECDHQYSALPLYALPKGWTLVPVSPTEGMLRPFIECPEDELRLAWEAMLRVTAATVPVVDMEGEVRAVHSEWTSSRSGLDDERRWQAMANLICEAEKFYLKHHGKKKWDALMDETNRILALDDATLLDNLSERPSQATGHEISAAEEWSRDLQAAAGKTVHPIFRVSDKPGGKP